MDKVERKRLIKSLLSGRLSKKQRKAFADLESVDIEIKKQWNESGNRAADMAIKEQIWKKVKAKCEYRKNNRVQVELRHFLAFDSVSRSKFHRIALSFWIPTIYITRTS